MVDTIHNIVGNKIVARGRIAGFGRDYEGRREVYIYIRGAYQERPINVSFTYREIDPDLIKGDFVEIEGHVVSFFRRSEVWSEDRARSNVQYFVADKITPLKTEIEDAFGIRGGFSYGHMFIRLYYQGEVTRVDYNQGSVTTPDGKKRDVVYTRILVRTPQTEEARRSNIISAQYTSRMRVAELNPSRGDKVVVVANLTSNRKNVGENGAPVYFRNIIVDDMVITERAPEVEEPVTSVHEDTPAPAPAASVQAPAEEVKEAPTPTEEVVIPKAEPGIVTQQPAPTFTMDEEEDDEDAEETAALFGK